MGQPPHFFAAWIKYDDYGEHILGPAIPWTSHEFIVNRRQPDYFWKWRIDGELRWTQWNSFTAGKVGGQREVHNDCENAYARWWGLRYFDRYWLEWYPWYDLEEAVDTNPYFHLWKISNTEFRVVHD